MAGPKKSFTNVNNSPASVAYLLVAIKSMDEQAYSAGAVEYTNCNSAEGKNLRGECLGYDTKQSDGEASVMLKLWGMRSTPSLPLLLGPL